MKVVVDANWTLFARCRSAALAIIKYAGLLPPRKGRWLAKGACLQAADVDVHTLTDLLVATKMNETQV
jgi:hypothetical protein